MRYADVAETHSAAVFFLGDRAYKVKKPVDSGSSTSATGRREAICHREVELNRRLAPDVYLGVADVTDPDGELCDHLVVMRRLPEDRRLSHAGPHRRRRRRPLWQLAHQLAAFHAGAERGAAADARPASTATRRSVGANTGGAHRAGR